jgi:hypothetical protein
MVTYFLISRCGIVSDSLLAPSPAPGIIQGVLPPLLLAILFAVLPFILRGMSVNCVFVV